ADRATVLVNPASVTQTTSTLRDLEPAALAIGIQLQRVDADSSREIDAAFAAFERKRPHVLFVASSPLFHQPARALGPVGGSPRDTGELLGPAICRRRRADELRRQSSGAVASTRRLCRPHPQGH